MASKICNQCLIDLMERKWIYKAHILWTKCVDNNLISNNCSEERLDMVAFIGHPSGTEMNFCY